MSFGLLINIARTLSSTNSLVIAVLPPDICGLENHQHFGIKRNVHASAHKMLSAFILLIGLFDAAALGVDLAWDQYSN